MEGVEETVEDWWDLVQQIRKRAMRETDVDAPAIAAMLILARELKWYRQWAEENHSA